MTKVEILLNQYLASITVTNQYLTDITDTL